MDMTPEEIDSLAVRALCHREAAAFARLEGIYFPRLDGYFRKRGAHSEADRLDLIQQTWLKAVWNPSRFCERQVGFEAWFVTIAWRVLIDHWRRTARRRRLLDSADMAAPVDDRLPIDWPPSGLLEKLMECVNGLSEEYREIIALRWRECLSFEEIRRCMSAASASAVRSKHDRARKKLQECMGLAPEPKENKKKRERRKHKPVSPGDGEEPAEAGREGSDDD